jgi:hypothetical protein
VPRVSLPIAGRCTASPPLALRPAPAAAHTSPYLPCRGPCHDLVPLARKETSLTALRERRAAAVRHGCHPVSSTSGLRLEPIDPVAASIAPLRPPCAAHWLAQPLPPPRSLVYGSRRRRLGPPRVSSVRRPLSQPTAALNLLSRTS